MDFTFTEGGRGATQALLMTHNNDRRGMQVARLRDDAAIVEILFVELENEGQTLHSMRRPDCGYYLSTTCS